MEKLRARVRARSRRNRVAQILIVLSAVLAVVAVGWGIAGYVALGSAVDGAKDRLEPSAVQALAPPDGQILTSPRTILLLGVDRGSERPEEGPGRSDAMLLVRTDPGGRRIAFLSIPRDLRVEIPGHGVGKANHALALGGPGLAVRTVETVTGLEVNHVAVADFDDFGELVDALGGVTVDVPAPIVSFQLRCPYETEVDCERWRGDRFTAGEQRLTGRRALIYSRIRQNWLAPDETDVARTRRQQQVLRGIASELVSAGTYVRLPLVADELVEPLATDLTASELVQLALLKTWTPRKGILECHLGGTAKAIAGVEYLVGTAENASILEMVTGKRRPKAPPRGSGPFTPGCLAGERRE